jgi:formylglycine-generating enzyme required for sulfatase activity
MTMHSPLSAVIDGRRMVRIPAGPFLFGSCKSEVTLTEFWIDPYPVTNAELASFVPEHRFVPHRASHPATWVSWVTARQYLKAIGLDLPTQQQWEKASRGVDGRLYPWGDEHNPRRFNVLESDIRETTEVHHYADRGASPYGVMDMAGNVWEWTLTDSAPEHGAGKLVCGGAYDLSWFEMQLGLGTYEIRDPKNGYPTVGFRGVGVL